MAAKNRKNASQFCTISHGKGMLPIWAMRHTFVTTPLCTARDERRSQQEPQCYGAIVILAFRGKHDLSTIRSNMWQTYATIMAYLSDESHVVAERRLRLGRSLYQRAESLKSLSLLRSSGWTRADGVGFWSALSSPPCPLGTPCSAGWARAAPSALARAI